jgi:hypothetical protein
MLPKTLTDALKSFVQREFMGESLKWAHLPPPGAAFRAGLVVWFFGIPWTAFTVFWEATAIRQYLQGSATHGKPSLMLVLWGIPFVLIGLVMMSAPFWAWRQARRSVWVLSDRRLSLITAGRKATKIRSIMPGDILAIERAERADGTGHLKLMFQSTRDSEGHRQERSEQIAGIAGVRQVETLIRAMNDHRTGKLQ